MTVLGNSDCKPRDIFFLRIFFNVIKYFKHTYFNIFLTMWATGIVANTAIPVDRSNEYSEMPMGTCRK